MNFLICVIEGESTEHKEEVQLYRLRLCHGTHATVSAQNETPMNAPLRVRVVEMVVEVTSEQTECAFNLLPYSQYHCRCAELSLNFCLFTVCLGQCVFA